MTTENNSRSTIRLILSILLLIVLFIISAKSILSLMHYKNDFDFSTKELDSKIIQLSSIKSAFLQQNLLASTIKEAQSQRDYKTVSDNKKLYIKTTSETIRHISNFMKLPLSPVETRLIKSLHERYQKALLLCKNIIFAGASYSASIELQTLTSQGVKDCSSLINVQRDIKEHLQKKTSEDYDRSILILVILFFTGLIISGINLAFAHK